MPLALACPHKGNNMDNSTIERKIRNAWTPARRKAQAERIRIINAGRYGSKHPRWRGGRRATGDGYIRITVAPDHPLSGMAQHYNGTGFYCILEHRLVMAE